MSNLRQSNMHTGGIKSKPTSPRPPAPPAISVVGTGAKRPSPVKVGMQKESDGSYSFMAYALDGTPLPDIEITETQFKAISEQKEQYFSISYAHDDEPFQNRETRRKKKFGKSSKGEDLL